MFKKRFKKRIQIRKKYLYGVKDINSETDPVILFRNMPEAVNKMTDIYKQEIVECEIVRTITIRNP